MILLAIAFKVDEDYQISSMVMLLLTFLVVNLAHNVSSKNNNTYDKTSTNHELLNQFGKDQET